MDVGVIGVGVMGRNHVRVYSELKRATTVFIYDTNEETVRQVASQFDATPCSSLDEVLRSVEAVSICTPTPSHKDLSLKAFSHGIHTLIEKPICSSTDEGRQLLAAMPKDLVIGVGHIERFNPIIDEIKKIIHTPVYIEIKRHNPGSSRVTDVTVVEDLMIHDIDVVFDLLPDREYTIQSLGTSDVCSALIYMGSTPVYLSASRMAAKKTRSLYIEERDCTIEGNYMTQEITVYRRPSQYAIEHQRYIQESVIEVVMVNKVEPLKLELATFLSSIEKQKSFPVTPDQAVRNLLICDEIKRGLVR